MPSLTSVTLRPVLSLGPVQSLALGDALVHWAASGPTLIGRWVPPVAGRIASVDFCTTSAHQGDPTNGWRAFVQVEQGTSSVRVGQAASAAPSGAAALAPNVPVPVPLDAAQATFARGQVLVVGIEPVGTPDPLACPSFTVNWTPT